MAQQINLSTDKNRITVSPGAQTEFRVTIQNLTTLVDDVSVSVADIDASWSQVIPPHIPIFAQGEASVRVIIQPPSDPLHALAGIYPLRVLGSLQEMTAEPVETSLELEVQFGGDYRIELGKGSAANNQEAIFPFIVHNDANAPLNLRCFGEDARSSYWYKFDPFQFTVAPGSDARTTLSIRPKQSMPGSANVNFTLKTQGEWTISGMPSVDAPGKQVNGQWGQPTLPGLIVSINPPRFVDTNRGIYQVLVVSSSPVVETVLLEGTGANGQLNFHFEPIQLAIKPHGEAGSVLTAWPAAPANPTGQAAFDFLVTARSASGKLQPGSAPATFVRGGPAGKRPAWLIPVIILIVILLIGCVIGLAFLFYFRNGSPNRGLGFNIQPVLWAHFLTRSILDGSIHNYFC